MELEITSGSTSFFSWVYRPAPQKPQAWYRMTGNASRKAAISMILSAP